MQDTSPTLLARLRSRSDEEAWERFVQLYTPLLVYWGRKTGLAEHDLRDLVQEVFALLLHKLPEFHYDPQQTFRGWLRVVALNKWRELNRRQNPLPVGSAVQRQLDPAADALQTFWDREYAQFVTSRAIELMQAYFEPRTWRACLETAVRGRSAEEVAAELEMSVAAVYQARSRVLRRLREELAELLE